MEDDDMDGIDEINLSKGKSHLTVNLSDAIFISWKPSGNESVILNQKTFFEGKPDLRGGAPIVLPTYAPFESGPFQKWMKMDPWDVKEGFTLNSDSITLIQQETDEIRNSWNYKFKIELTVMLLNETQLKLDTVITNTGDEKFSFSCSFYSYFTVEHVLNSKMFGLNGCTYAVKVSNVCKRSCYSSDSMTENKTLFSTLSKFIFDTDCSNEKVGKECLQKTWKQCVEDQEELKLSDLSQRIYKSTPTVQKVEKLPSNSSVKFEKFNLPDIVVFNPYGEQAEADWSDKDYQNTICVETGTVDSLVALEPNKSYAAHLILTVE